jgi:hypothetical protein
VIAYSYWNHFHGFDRFFLKQAINAIQQALPIVSTHQKAKNANVTYQWSLRPPAFSYATFEPCKYE